MSVRSGHCKGLNLRTFWASLETLCGPEVVARTRDLLPAEVAEAVESGAIVAGGFYPVEWYRACHEAAMRATGRGLDLARDIGRESTRADFRGVYRFFAIILSPESLLRRSMKLWSMYWSTGTVTLLAAERGHLRTQFVDCEGFDAVLWKDIMGSIEALLELGGAKDIALRVVSGGTGTDLELDATWHM